MTVVVEILLTSRDLPLVELAGSIPSGEISIESAVMLEDGRCFLLATIPADSHDAFERELDDQDEIADWTPVGRAHGRWFYQLLLDDISSLYEVYDPTRVDAVSVESTVTDEGGFQRLLFSDYDEFGEFRRRCERAGLPFELLAISADPASPERAPRSGLTDRQHEALTVAHERGYYDSPRRASTAEVAEELGVSAPAVSKLLRRAERELVGQVVGSERPLERVN